LYKSFCRISEVWQNVEKCLLCLSFVTLQFLNFIQWLVFEEFFLSRDREKNLLKMWKNYCLAKPFVTWHAYKFFIFDSIEIKNRWCAVEKPLILWLKSNKCFSWPRLTSSPGPSLWRFRRFSKWRLVGRRPWQRLDHVVQNRQKSRRFLSCDILRKAKTQNGAKFSYRWNQFELRETNLAAHKNRVKNKLFVTSCYWAYSSKMSHLLQIDMWTWSN